MFLINGTYALTRDNCYSSIAENRCTFVVSEIVNFFLKESVSAFEERSIVLWDDIKNKFRNFANKKLEESVHNECFKKFRGIYEKELSSLTENQVCFVAQFPTAEKEFSLTHYKFLSRESRALLLENVIKNIVKAGEQSFNEIVEEIPLMTLENIPVNRAECFLLIIEKHFANIKVTSKMIYYLLEGVFLGFEEESMSLSKETKEIIRNTVGKKLEKSLKDEYVKITLDSYEKVFFDLTDEEICLAAINPSELAGLTAKFRQKEKEAVLSAKEKFNQQIEEITAALLKQPGIMEEIFQRAKEPV